MSLIIMPSSISSLRFLNRRWRVSLPRSAALFSRSLIAWRILLRAFEVTAKFSQSSFGHCAEEVRISTVSPFASR